MEKNDIDLKEEENKIPFHLQIIFFILFFVIGMINNLGYCLILTGSQKLSSQLNNQSLIALYPLALITFSSLARFVNSKFCIKISYIKRVIGLSIYFFCGYISLFLILFIVEKSGNQTLGNTAAFILTLLPSFIMGTGCSFGEASILGYLRLFPKNLVAGWSSGTGLAGVTGALITIIFKLKNVSFKWLYLLISPVCLLYFFCFFITSKLGNSLFDFENSKEEKDKDNKELDSSKEEDGNENMNLNNRQVNIITNVEQNKEMTFNNFIIGFSKAKKFIINLALVYYFEYVVLSGLSERVAVIAVRNEWKLYSLNSIVYEIFSLCYQIGVLISRSSLIVVKHIPFVQIFSIFQFINFLFWITETWLSYIKLLWFLMLHLIIVGLFGGSAYVGCFYFLLNSNEIDENIKELSVNIGTIFNDLGIMLSSLTVLLLDRTVFNFEKNTSL